MSDQSEKTETGRRGFLKAAGVGSLAAALGAVAAGPAEAAAPAEQPEAGGYRETEHVRDYYTTAKF